MPKHDASFRRALRFTWQKPPFSGRFSNKCDLMNQQVEARFSPEASLIPGKEIDAQHGLLTLQC
jgi:hypothetical protein